MRKRFLVLSNRVSFIKYLRDNYSNREIGKIKYNNQEIGISLSFDGELYNQTEDRYFERVESSQLWDKLYGLARLGELDVFG